MPSFPRPDGPYSVGAVSQLIIDHGRPAHLLSGTPGRQLFLKLWYPTLPKQGASEHLWADLRQRDDLPLSLRVLLWRFRKVKTATRPQAAFQPAAPLLPLVVYSHGLVSFAGENTSLMETLASHGFVVLAIDHREQMAELQALNRHFPSPGPPARVAAKALKRASPAERARMGRESFTRAHNTNRIVAERAADIGHVLERLHEIAIPGLDSRDLLASGLFQIGLSLGGAVATEFAALERGCRAVVNMDGGMFGTHIGSPPEVPYLMLYSGMTEGLNDALLPEGAERQTPPRTAHLNYHDISMLMPELKLIGAVGKTDPRQFIDHRNRTLLGFLLRHTAPRS